MKRLLALVLLTQSFVSAFASVNDVVPKKFANGSAYVRVTKVGTDKVKFEKCIKGSEAKSCKILGPKSAYSLKSLIKQRQIENRQAAGTIAADIVVIAGAALTGGALASSLFAGAAEFSSGIFFVDAAVKTTAVAGTACGVGVGAYVGAATTLIDAMNPVLQVAQARTLNTDVLEDKKVEKGNINEYIKNLDTVLSKIKA